MLTGEQWERKLCVRSDSANSVGVSPCDEKGGAVSKPRRIRSYRIRYL